MGVRPPRRTDAAGRWSSSCRTSRTPSPGSRASAWSAGEGVGGYFATPSLSPYQEAEASLTVRAQEVTALSDALAGRLRAPCSSRRGRSSGACPRRSGARRRSRSRRGEEIDLEALALAPHGARLPPRRPGRRGRRLRGARRRLRPLRRPATTSRCASTSSATRSRACAASRSSPSARTTSCARPPSCRWRSSPEAPRSARRLARAWLAARRRAKSPGARRREHIATLADGGAASPAGRISCRCSRRASLTLAELLPEATLGGDRSRRRSPPRRRTTPTRLRRGVRGAARAPALRARAGAARASGRDGLGARRPARRAAVAAARGAGARRSISASSRPTSSTASCRAFRTRSQATRARGERLLLVAPRERHARARRAPRGARRRARARAASRSSPARSSAAIRLPGRRRRDLRRDAAPAAAALARRQARKRGRFGPFLATLRDLKVGDHVVHADHGIGQFVALRSVGGRAAGARPGAAGLAAVRSPAPRRPRTR